MKRTKLPTRSKFAACVVIVCLVTLQCEWTVVAQASGTSATASAAGSSAGRGPVFLLEPSPSSGPFAAGVPLFAVNTEAAAPVEGKVPRPLRAAVDTAVADGVVRATLLASRAQVVGPGNAKKNNTLMWILIGAGAGGAALAFALLKSDGEPKEITVGTPEVGAPQ